MFEIDEINKNSPIPMYYQLKSLILKEINDGKLKVGDCIPTEAELIDSFGISRTTVRQAILELVNEGHLKREKGKGTFVTRPKLEQRLMQSIIKSYKQEIEPLGMKPSTKVLELRKMSQSEFFDFDDTIGTFSLKPHEKLIFLKRLRFADDEPMLIDMAFMKNNCSFLMEVGKEAVEKNGLYFYLSKYRATNIVHVLRNITAILASEEESRLLNVSSGSPVQCITTLAYNADEELVEFSIAKYRGDRSKFRVELFDK